MDVCVWYSNFKTGQEFLENEPWRGRSWTENAERISKVLMPANQQITIREVSNEVGISYGSAQAILTMQQFFAGKQITLMPKPPYSPHLAATDFWLFCRLQMRLLSQCFVTFDMRCSAIASLCPMMKEAFHECCHAWQNCWSKCVCTEGFYFVDDQTGRHCTSHA